MSRLYTEYDPATLFKLQKVELEILKDFCDLCEENNIEYFGAGGTAIGAVRHQGFIPWDDDIDVSLLREDYERFLVLAKEQLNDKYYLLTAETSKHYPLMSARLIKRGTKFREECFADLDCDLGIFLDIYALDNIPDDDKAMRRQGYSAWFWGKLLVLTEVSKPVLYISGWKARFVKICCMIVYRLFKIFRVSHDFLYNKAKKASTRYSGAETKRVAYFFDPMPFTSIIKREHIFPTKHMEYDGLQVRFMNRTEEYLRTRYGDFMELPPPDKRHNHPPYELDFGEGE